MRIDLPSLDQDVADAEQDPDVAFSVALTAGRRV
jgi:hypothetical protein